MGHWDKPPLEVYHGVPEGWRKESIIGAHQRLNPNHELEVPEATEPGAPAWLPDRYNWLQYRASLYEVAAGIKQACPACVELGVRYIELDYMGSYSGYIKERLATVLRGARLSSDQESRLMGCIDALAAAGQRRYEWRQYSRLAASISGAGQKTKQT